MFESLGGRNHQCLITTCLRLGIISMRSLRSMTPQGCIPTYLYQSHTHIDTKTTALLPRKRPFPRGRGKYSRVEEIEFGVNGSEDSNYLCRMDKGPLVILAWNMETQRLSGSHGFNMFRIA